MLPPTATVDDSTQPAEEGTTVQSFSEQAEQSKDVPTTYSYEDYSPKPAVIYTCSEDEADDLVSCLRGYVHPYNLERYH